MRGATIFNESRICVLTSPSRVLAFSIKDYSGFTVGAMRFVIRSSSESFLRDAADNLRNVTKT